MEASSASFICGISASKSNLFIHKERNFNFNNNHSLCSNFGFPFLQLIRNSTTSNTQTISVKTITKKRQKQPKRQIPKPPQIQTQTPRKIASISSPILSKNGDPLGKKDLGKAVVRWITQGMRAMASDLASAEMQGEFLEVKQRMGPGLTFVIQAQPYLNAISMPLGFESMCLKACTHYPTLFDNFQRELRDVLQELQSNSLIPQGDWHNTQSWQLLKELANSTQHRAIVHKVPQSKPSVLSGGLGMDNDKAKAIQNRIDDFVNRMSDLLRVERDAELEFTQEELNAVPMPDENSDSSKPIEYLVSHGQAEQELCDTICNLNAVSSSTGLGGMHLVLFRVEGNHRLPPTTLSPGDMVCVRTCDNRGCSASSCMQGFINNLGEDGCSISVALESRHGDPTFSKLFGKTVRIDRINGLADALTYERNCEALMLLQKKGLQKKNPSTAIVATLFGDEEDIAWLEQNQLADWTETELDGLLQSGGYDDSQLKAVALGLNKKRLVLIVQGPPGTGKTILLKEVIARAVQQGERVLVTAPTNAAVDNMVEKLSNIGLNIVRVGNPVRISKAVASKSLGKIVSSKLEPFVREFERKKADLRKDLRHCLKDDSLTAGIRQLLKQLGNALKKKEKETMKEALSIAQVVLCTNTGATDLLIRRLDTFDLVVIDEAGQAIEPSCWIPILQGKCCILAGDQCQLAPVVLSRKALVGGLGVSLLERASTLHEGVLSTMLTTQYRMNDAIASWASKEMYNGLLQSSSAVAKHLLVDSPFVKKVTTILEQRWLSKLLGYDYEIQYKKGIENKVVDALSRFTEETAHHYAISKVLPHGYKKLFQATLRMTFLKSHMANPLRVAFLDTRMPYGSLSVGWEEHLDPGGTGSFYNEGEADIVVQHVYSLICAGVAPTTIAVQSPYVAQVQLLRDRLDELPEAVGVEVATVDSFQGREADAVIISMVRSNTLGAVGFLGDSRRMNVAITRARKHVTVVCDSSTICHNTFLARLLRHIRHYGRVKHVEPDTFGGSGLSMNPMLPYIS